MLKNGCPSLVLVTRLKSSPFGLWSLSKQLVWDPIEPATTTGLGQRSAGFSIYFINHEMLLEEFKHIKIYIIIYIYMYIWCAHWYVHTYKTYMGLSENRVLLSAFINHEYPFYLMATVLRLNPHFQTHPNSPYCWLYVSIYIYIYPNNIPIIVGKWLWWNPVFRMVKSQCLVNCLPIFAG